MTLSIFGALFFAALMALVIGLKVFKDRDMSLRDGAMVLVLMCIVVYGLVVPGKVPSLVMIVCMVMIWLRISANITEKVSRRLGERLAKRQAQPPEDSRL